MSWRSGLGWFAGLMAAIGIGLISILPDDVKWVACICLGFGFSEMGYLIGKSSE